MPQTIADPQDDPNTYVTVLRTADDVLDLLTRQVPGVLLVDIYPTAASALLDVNTNNRRTNPARVNMLVNTLQSDGWMLTNDAIMLDWDGQLTNGQHRLKSSVAAGLPIRVMLLVGSDPHARDVVDTGQRRSFAQALTMRGEFGTTNLAAALSLHWRYEHGLLVPGQQYGSGNLQVGQVGGRGRAQIGHDVLLKHLADNPGIRDCASRNSNIKWHVPAARTTAAAVCDYVTSRIDPYESAAFMERFRKGENLSPGDPELALRNRIGRTMTRPRGDDEGDVRPPSRRGSSVSTEYQLSLMLKAWNYRRRGERRQTLSIKPTEAYPRAI